MKALILCLSLAAPAFSQSAKRTVLVVGDSHSAGTFGGQLLVSLKEQPNTRVAFFAVCSSGPNSWLNETEHGCGFQFRGPDGTVPSKWLRTRKGTIKVNGREREVEFVKTPKLSVLLEDYKPDAVIVALGSNPTSADGVKALLDLVHASRSECAWIGPPYMRSPSKDAVDATYKNALQKSGVDPALKLSETRENGCSLVDSREFSYLRYPDGAGDGTHYEATEGLREKARQWAKDAARAFAGR